MNNAHSSSKPSQKSSIFGDACPREVVLAQRTGKREQEILAEEAMHEKLHLRLAPRQEAEKLKLEQFITELEWSLNTAQDQPTKDTLQTELSKQKLQLETLISQYEREAIEKAKHGIGVRSSERMARSRSMEYEEYPVQDGYPGGRFGQGRGRRQFGSGNYEQYYAEEERYPGYGERQEYDRTYSRSGSHHPRFM